MTYVAVHDARAIVWISETVREEHRQALDWLNQHTDEDLDFFGVVMELLRIEDSRPAVQFRVVAKPNEWRKVARPTSGSSPKG